MKPYFEDLAWYDYLLCFVYNGIFSYMAYKIGEVFLGLQHRTLRILLVAFQVYFFVTMADAFWNFLPMQPETSWYAFMVSSGQYPEDAQVNLLVLYYLSLFFSIVCLNTPIIYVFLCILLYLVAAMVLLQAWKMLDTRFSATTELQSARLMLFWPAPILFMTAPLQTAFILLGFAFFFRGWVTYLRDQKIPALLIGAVVMIALQFESIYWVIPAVLGTMLYKQSMSVWLKAGITILVIAGAGLLFSRVIADAPLTPQHLADMRNTSIAEADMYGYGNVYWTTYGEMARDYPFIVLQFLLAPLPIFMQFDLLSSPVASADGIFMALITLLAMVTLLRRWKDLQPVGLLLLFLLIFLGGAADNWMHAMADRMILGFLLIVLAASTLTRKQGSSVAEHTMPL